MANAKTPSDLTRPLSPHLQIYRPMLTMMMSIAHRITGAALYIGSILLIWLLVAAATGPHAYEIASAVFGSIIGRIVLFGYTLALFHHMFGGLRHLLWDTGVGMESDTRNTIAWATVVASLGLTVIVWAIFLVAK